MKLPTGREIQATHAELNSELGNSFLKDNNLGLSTNILYTNERIADTVSSENNSSYFHMNNKAQNKRNRSKRNKK